MCLYSAGRTVHLSTYLVGWDESLTIKVGVTLNTRWRQFCTRGARLYYIHRAGNMPEVGWVRLESQVEAWLAEHVSRAFQGREEAAELLGHKGAGWTECYRAESELAYRNALASCASIMREHPAGICASTLPAQMHGRTDARTYVDHQSPSAINSLSSNARARIGEMG